jgi:ketosteroid isomerase-like protein
VDEEIRSIYVRAAAAVEQGDREAFVGLFHPDVELRSVLTDQVYRGHAGVNAWFEVLTSALVLAPTVTEIESVDANAWYVTGRLQASQPEGGIADHPMTWLVILDEGLIWHSRSPRGPTPRSWPTGYGYADREGRARLDR